MTRMVRKENNKRKRSLTNITFCPDGKHGSNILRIRTSLLQFNLCIMLHRMRIRQNPPSLYNKPTATRAILPFPLPRQREIRLSVNTKNLHHRVHSGYNPSYRALLINQRGRHIAISYSWNRHRKGFSIVGGDGRFIFGSFSRASAATSVVVGGWGHSSGVNEFHVVDGEQNVVLCSAGGGGRGGFVFLGYGGLLWPIFGAAALPLPLGFAAHFWIGYKCRGSCFLERRRVKGGKFVGGFIKIWVPALLTMSFWYSFFVLNLSIS